MWVLHAQQDSSVLENTATGPPSRIHYARWRNAFAFIMWRCTHAASTAVPLTRKDKAWHAECFNRLYRPYSTERYHTYPEQWANVSLEGYIPTSPSSNQLLACDYEFRLHANGLYMTMSTQKPRGYMAQYNGPSHYAAWGILNDACLKPRKSVFPLLA